LISGQVLIDRWIYNDTAGGHPDPKTVTMVTKMSGKEVEQRWFCVDDDFEILTRGYIVY
jgi:hypothetical protein